MATKKAEKQGGALVNYEDQLLARAKARQKMLESVQTGTFLSVRGGVMTYNGNSVAGNKLDVVVLSDVLENAYYEGRFDPESPQSPVCFAFGDDEETMRPHEKSSDPQAERCKGCPRNEFGSADTGRGKACKNSVRMAFMTADAAEDKDAVATAKVVMFKVPVTSVKSWKAYADQLAAAKSDPIAHVTELSCGPDPKNQVWVNFKAKHAVPRESLEALFKKSDETAQSVRTPYQPSDEEPKKKPAAKKSQPAGGNAPRRKF